MNTDRVLRDVESGILVIDNHGRITSINPSAKRLLRLEDDICVGQSYSKIMSDNTDSRNDEFHQFVFDAVYHKERLHKGKASYFSADDEVVLLITSSFLYDDNGRKEGVIITFDDVTEEEKLHRQLKTSSMFFIMVIVSVTGWNFIVAMLEYFGVMIPDTYVSKFEVVCGMIPCLIYAYKTKMKPEDAGLTIKGKGKYILQDCVITAVLVAVLCLLKLTVLKDLTYYDNGHFMDFAKYPLYGYCLHIISVVLQEYIVRGMIHGNMRKILQGKHAEAAALIVSSLCFGALHIHQGLRYMVGAAILLSLMGTVYNKQNSIWGLSIMHFVLGNIFGILGFVVY